jgi:hypothetical protein
MNTQRNTETANDSNLVSDAVKAIGKKIEPTAFVSASVGKFYNKV